MRKLPLFFILCFCVQLLSQQVRAQISLWYADTTVYSGATLEMGVSSYSSPQDVLPGGMGDRFSGKIDIGFPFIYFGTSYEQLVISENNFVSFDTSLANMFSNYVYSTAVSAGHLNHAILFPFQDIYDISGSISYQRVGIVPHRKFIVTLCRVPLYPCDTVKTTNQLVLNEGSNTIEMYITYKSSNCTIMDNGTGIQGLKNGSTQIYVPGRNVAQVPWAVNSDARLFTPSGNNNYVISSPAFQPWHSFDSLNAVDLKWYDENNVLVGNGLTATVNPTTANHYYTVRYSGITGDCDTSLYTFTDTVHVSVTDTTTSVDTTSPPTAINDIRDLERNLKIYPNPAENRIVVEAGKEYTIKTVTLWNILGASVPVILQTERADKKILTFDGTASGMYYLEIITDRGLLRRKVQLLNP